MSDNAHRGTILVVDDDIEIRKLYALLLEMAGYLVYDCGSAADARRLLGGESDEPIDAIVLDVMMPDETGLDFLAWLCEQHADIPTVMVTASSDVEHAVFALKNGAFDYLVKPAKKEDLLLTARSAVEKGQMARELRVLRALDPNTLLSDDEAVFASDAMRSILGIVEQVKGTTVPVMILGESGSGKEVIARLLHRRSAREGAFVAINCAALPSDLIESELFGHEKGAFTGASTRRKGRFEEAEGGTIFLDEVGELDHNVQAKLLRVLQEKEVTRVGGQTVPVNVRVLVATNRDLERDVREGRFRADLYYRLDVITLQVPPLRQRRDEIPVLAEHLLKRFSREEGVPLKALSPGALERLSQYDWPGNVRELGNVLKRSVLLSSGDYVTEADLVFQSGNLDPSSIPTPGDRAPVPGSGPIAPSPGMPALGHHSGPMPLPPGAMGPGAMGPGSIAPGAMPPGMGMPMASTLPPVIDAPPAQMGGPVRKLRDYEPELMMRALAETRGNVSAAARKLGIGRATFYRRAKRYKLPI